MLEIHEFRLDVDLESGGVRVAVFSAELDRLSSVGRFGVAFASGGVASGGGDGGFSTGGAVPFVPLETCASCR